MAVVEFASPVLVPPPLSPAVAAPAFASIGSMTAGTHKTAYIIRAPKAGTLDWFEARQHANTNNPDNGLRFSFQGVSLATGDPDGTQDEYRAVTAGFAAGAWLVPPGVMTSDGTDTGTKRTVTRGELLACVVEYENFVAGDSVQMSAISAVNSSSSHGLNAQYVDFFGAAWTKAADYAPIALKYNDSTYGIVHPAYPITVVNTRTFGSGSSPNHRGIYFQVPVAWRVIGAWVRIDMDGDADVILYNSSDTVLASASHDLNVRQNTAGNTTYFWFDAAVTLAISTNYRLIVKPTTATNVSIYDYDVSTAALRAALPFGTYRQSSTGAPGGWTELDTNYGPEMGLIIDGTDVAAESTKGYFAIG